METAGTVAVVGSVNVDVVASVARLPEPGETVLGSALAVHPGGKGANQAVAAARQGARVLLVGAVGRDAQAVTALALAREAGVDLTRVREVDAPTGTALVAVDARGENTIVVVPGANARVEPAWGEDDAVARADVVLLQGEVPAQASAAAALAAAGRVVLNLAPVVPIPDSVIARADPLVVNAGEAAQFLAGRGVPAPERPEALVAALVAAGARSAVVTLGGAGAVLADDGGVPARVPAPAVPVLDTTGAGDAFAGALAARLAAGDALPAAAAHAVRVAARSVQHEGAQRSYPCVGEALPGVAPGHRPGA